MKFVSPEMDYCSTAFLQSLFLKALYRYDVMKIEHILNIYIVLSIKRSHINKTTDQISTEFII